MWHTGFCLRRIIAQGDIGFQGPIDDFCDWEGHDDCILWRIGGIEGVC